MRRVFEAMALFGRVLSYCLDLLERSLRLVVRDFEQSEWLGGTESESLRFFPQNDGEQVDPFCVEDNPHRITFEDITSAAFKIKCGVVNTPCVVC